jgi:hypothetical protein
MNSVLVTERRRVKRNSNSDISSFVLLDAIHCAEVVEELPEQLIMGDNKSAVSGNGSLRNSKIVSVRMELSAAESIIRFQSNTLSIGTGMVLNSTERLVTIRG